MNRRRQFKSSQAASNMDPSSTHNLKLNKFKAPAAKVPLQSAPEKRTRRRSGKTRRDNEGNGSNNSLNDDEPTYLKNEQKLEGRSRKLTWSFIALVAAITCLSPFQSLHLTQRVGLLLFESDIIQLQASLFSVIICLIILVILYLVIFLHSKLFRSSQKDGKINPKTRRIVGGGGGGLMLQRFYKQLIGLLAIISAISYLSLALLVPHIKQIQRMPIATFDCNANLITIENCHQQFTTRGGEQSLVEALGQLLFGYGSVGHSNRLIKKFHCFQYQDEELGSPKVPTRFLLHHCGLVCKPQRQQLHQFSDDLNREQQQPEGADERAKARLVPPYHHAVKDTMKQMESGDPETGLVDGTHLVYHNATSSKSSIYHPDHQQQQEVPRQVSLRVCFSSDFSSGSSYKQFCITNLAANAASDHHGGQGGHTLTVGQLNAMLRKFAPIQHPADNNAEPITGSTQTGREESSRVTDGHDQRFKSESDDDEPIRASQTKSKLQIEDQTTHYVNPIVQFESHFRNWPHLSTGATNPGSTRGTSTSDGDSDDNNGDGWCKFRPIPPFIVNNKPFNDIQCSLEHEYTMTTTSPSSFSADESDVDKKMAGRIYLKKSQAGDGSHFDGDPTSGGEGFLRDRCNIQCKVNILYQIQAGKSETTIQEASLDHTGVHQQQHFYLPLKPCIIVSGHGDKLQTSNYYLLFRSLGDSTLVMAFILLDLYLLFEAIDSRKSQFESKKYRLTGILLVLTITPLTLALLFDLISIYSPVYSATRPTMSDNYLSTFLFDRLLPSLVDLFYSRPSSTISNGHGSSNNNQIKRKQSNGSSDEIRQNLTSMNVTQSIFHQDTSSTSFMNFDNFTLPFFVYSILMFILALNSWTLPLVTSTAPLVRASSAEELGMSNVVGSSCSINNIGPQNGRQLGKQPTGSTSKLNSNNNNLKPEVALDRSRQLREHKSNKQATKLISFLLIASFMGIQFNLSQHIQVQILVETFGNPAVLTGGGGGNNFTVTWFVFGTQSTATIFVLCLVLIFANETSTFFSNSFPLFNLESKPIDSVGDDHVGPRQRQSNKFLKYIALAQIIYSFRYFALLSLNSTSRFKWMMVFLIQVAEIFNFPIVWLALTSRVHELIAEHPAGYSTRSLKPLNSRVVDQASRTLVLNLHIVGQSSLALIYYGLSRYLALFVHSLYLSLHLHSDNVDWFINGFYHQKRVQMDGKHSGPVNSNGTRLNEDVIGAPEVRVSESLFSPLPSERQTYLHASRLFLKYNSILCLLIGSCLLLKRLYEIYRVWTMRMIQQRRVRKSNPNHQVEPKVNEDSSSSLHIDEQLSLDLMRIHHQSNNTIHVPPRSPGVRDERTSERVDWRNPRAKILFHYNLGHKDSSDESLSSTTELNSPTRATDGSLENSNHLPRTDELRIPIALAEEEEEEEEEMVEKDSEQRDEDDLSDGRRPSPLTMDENLMRHGPTEGKGHVLERVIKHRNKRVRIFEDDEEWPVEISPRLTPDVASDSSDGNGRQRQQHQRQEVVSPKMNARPHASSSGIANARPTKVSNVPQSPSNSREYLNNRRRTITFAPTATLIGHDRSSGRQLNVSVRTRDMGGLQAHPQHASPEPSIDSDDQEGESDGTIN